MKLMLMVGLGGFIGSTLRYSVGLVIKRYFELPIYTSTFLVNILGSFLIGITLATSLKGDISESTKLFLATGVCGGFTTFSAFAFENLELLKSGSYIQFALYVLLSLTIGVIAAYGGYNLIK